MVVGRNAIEAALAVGSAADSLDEGARDAIIGFTRRARETNPDFVLTTTQWSEQLWGALSDEPPKSWIQRLETLRAGELWLAAGCAAGNAKALATFESRFGSEIDRALARFAKAPASRTELHQQVRIRLMVAEPPEPARIRRYRGRGSLAAWVRTVAARVAINWMRAEKRRRVDPLPSGLVEANPGFARLREERRDVFVASLREAFRGLSRRDRNLLRLRHLDGMTAVALARAHGVHESTMSRWLAAARQTMLDNFGRAALARLEDSAVLPELLDAIRNRVDASLQGLFGTDRVSLSQPT